MASNSTNNTQSQTAHSLPSQNAVMADESANNPFFLPANENPGLVQPLSGPKNYMS